MGTQAQTLLYYRGREWRFRKESYTKSSVQKGKVEKGRLLLEFLFLLQGPTLLPGTLPDTQAGLGTSSGLPLSVPWAFP